MSASGADQAWADARESAGRESSGTTGRESGGASRPKVNPGKLTELRREAEKSSKELAEATKALEKRQATLAESDKELKAKLQQLQVATVELSKVRKPLADLVQSLYQAPAGGDVVPFLSSEDDSATLRAMSDMTYLVSGRDEVLEDAGRLYQEQQKLAAQAQELRSTKLLVEAQLGAEVDTLRKRSATVVKSLSQTLVKLGVRINQGGRTGAACDPTNVDEAAGYPNGLLPKSGLCPLQQRGHELRADAAIAFVALNEAYRRQFGRPMCVTDSYRNLADQQSVFYRRPGFAAVPGRSNHGLGLAVDLCGGVDQFRSAQFNWLEANGKKFGWIHPEWAYSSPFEPWHWEYDPKIGSLL
ncbi:D-alanyl-D-alanine carboxypeptidase family protein [Sphaerisporangium sp. TRM90804]|uniref:D-alanyl-D-alanine carboxypeptidase family protein n=1 Tax=Sphaerisporangium sp. TRM90804 TaxID=3031113 RepID=UPI00244C5618|nr:D-alanyl-D-alanine carboxypeptidase family protein [Sphaerisporangium sp. TRM90804]MDH2430472.1 D-alanyl-D-alanine carboxypeptidase family protein [Sphaerisporangium sp. TRM90804]